MVDDFFWRYLEDGCNYEIDYETSEMFIYRQTEELDNQQMVELVDMESWGKAYIHDRNVLCEQFKSFMDNHPKSMILENFFNIILEEEIKIVDGGECIGIVNRGMDEERWMHLCEMMVGQFRSNYPKDIIVEDQD